MKRKILLLFAVYCVSVCVAKYVQWIDLGIAVVFLASLLLLRLCFFRTQRALAIALVVCAGLGFGRAAALNNTAYYIPSEFVNKTVYVEGVVEERTTDAEYCTYVLQPERIYAHTSDKATVDAPVGYKIAVTVYERYATIAPYACGDRILVRGVLEVPKGPENTGAFDYALWYKTSGIYAKIKTDEAYTRHLGQAEINVVLRMARDVRGYAAEQFEKYIGGDGGALLSGIVLSERKGLSEELQAAIQKAGLSHICVASGMHVSMLCGFLLWLLSQLRISRKISYPICILLMHFFALVCGDGASVQRAVLMFDFSVLAYFTRGDEDRPYTCMCVAFLMLLMQPLYLFSVGFLLSFSCVFGILVFGEKVQSVFMRMFKWKPLADALAITLCAQMATLPILAAAFHEISVYGILYNLIIPWLVGPLMIVSGVLLAFSGIFPPAAQLLGFLLRLVLGGMCKTITAVEFLPFATFAIGMPNLLQHVLYYAVLMGIWACLEKKTVYALLCHRVMTICCLGLVCVSIVSGFYAKLSFINVGEGDSALLKMPYGLTVLIDGGGSAYENKNVGKETLLPYLKSSGVYQIDYAIVSHYDTDHADGVLYVCENMNVRNLILPYRHPSYSTENKTRLEACAEKRGIRVHYVQGGDSVSLPGGLEIGVLGPDAQMLERRLTENDLSLVFRICYGDASVLFTGDIEKMAEKRLVTGGAQLQAQILKVAHHGSSTSSTNRFLEMVNATYAVISAGDYRTASHPAPRVYNALKHFGAEVYNTAEAGDVTFYFTRRGVCWIQ